MRLDAEVADLEKNRKTLTRWGVWGTALYLGGLLGYGAIARQGFAMLSPNEVGDFLAGAFAPLAFLWLVLGYRMQALELEQNSKALRQQAEEMRNAVEQAAKQAEAAQANERYQRQGVINQTRQKYEDDLAGLAAEIAIGYSRKSLDDSWVRYSNGDKMVFVREVRNNIDTNKNHWINVLDAGSSDINEVVRIKAVEYNKLFDNFILVLSGVDPSDFFANYYVESEFGYLKTDLVGLLEGNK